MTPRRFPAPFDPDRAKDDVAMRDFLATAPISDLAELMPEAWRPKHEYLMAARSTGHPIEMLCFPNDLHAAVLIVADDRSNSGSIENYRIRLRLSASYESRSVPVLCPGCDCPWSQEDRGRFAQVLYEVCGRLGIHTLYMQIPEYWPVEPLPMNGPWPKDISALASAESQSKGYRIVKRCKCRRIYRIMGIPISTCLEKRFCSGWR